MINHNEASILSYEEVAQTLNTCPNKGLPSFEAHERLKKYGLNSLDDSQETRTIAKLLFQKIINFCKQFINPLIQLLLLCVLISAVIGEFENAISVLVAIILVCSISYIQEYRADKSLQKLNKEIPSKCEVLRDGVQIELLCDNLVPGDIIILQEGCRVPADVRLFKSESLTIDESNLTGETRSQAKIDTKLGTKKLKSALNGEIPVDSDKQNIIFQNLAMMGTLIESGQARGIVICTGRATRYGQVFEMLKSSIQPKSPLQKNIDQLSVHLVIIAICIIGFTSIIGIVQNRPTMEVAYYAISLAVTAIPEGLPVVVAVIMALGVLRLSKTQTIVKSLSSIETLGCFQILCADKTGTLTRNEMTLTDMVTSELHSYSMSELEALDGEDFQRHMTFNKIAGKMYSIGRLMEVGTLCNNATMEIELNTLQQQQQNQPTIITEDTNNNNQISTIYRASPQIPPRFLGSSTECAILSASMRLGFGDSRSKFDRLSEIPFSPKTRRMVVRCKRRDQPGNGAMYYVKGAWEEILADCTHYSEAGLVKSRNDDMWLEYGRIATTLGKQGLRVLALATGPELNQLTFVGYIGINNSPRDGIIETLGELMEDFRIDVKMITGDSRTTALAVGRTLGLLKGVDPDDEHLFLMSGTEAEKMIRSEVNDSLKSQDILQRTIFYRVDPMQKAEIISKLQQFDKVVAMTGDGINDVISLKRANLSIAMGSAADVCKEIADIIAVKNDLSVLIPALLEGKAIYQRVQAFLTYQISMSLALLVLVGISFACRYEPPFTVTQVLFINLLADGPPAQALGCEEAEEDELKKRAPRNIHEPLLNGRLIVTILALTSTMVINNGVLYLVLIDDDNKLDLSSRSIVFTNFVFTSVFAALSLRSKVSFGLDCNLDRH